ncbi:MAG: DUF3570 domain-containing protein [Fibrobacteria bacterium]
MLEITARIASAALLASALACHADQIEYSAYHVGDNYDNTVATTSFSLAKTLWQRTMIMLDVQLDQTTAPPLEDGVSGASRPARHSKSEFRKNRGQIIGGLEQGLGDDTKIMASYYFSQETDYQSQSFMGGITQSLAEKNFTITLRGQYILDSVGEILADGSIVNRFKETHGLSLILTQLLSPTTSLRVGADAMRNHGFLSDPYSKVPTPLAIIVTIKDDTITETHPSMRYRQAAWAEIGQYLRGLDASITFSYRYYWDDWGVLANSGALQINKYITPDWVFSPEYRYYEQTAADFGEYTEGADGYFQAVDTKLTEFSSNTVGATVTCFLRTFSRNHPTWDFLNNSSLAVTYLRYFTDTAPKNYTSDIWQGSLKFTF